MTQDFRHIKKHFHNVWIKQNAAAYFKERDQNALSYLQKVINELPAPIHDEDKSEFDKQLKGLLSVPPPKKEQ